MMKALYMALPILSIFYYVSAEETAANSTCKDFKNYFLRSFFIKFSSPQTYVGANFYLVSKNDNDDVELGKNNWSALKSVDFYRERKTFFIIHGYIHHYKTSWIKRLKKELLNTNNINLILIDWSNGSQTWNYVNAVETTYMVAQDIVKFLQDLKTEVSKLIESGNDLWQNLYFVGHSIGAHICGQTGYLLKNDSFFKVERISGLDPAQPCFTKIDQRFKLDISDADFVDIIHTQTGNGADISGFGIQEPIGHLDFYVNGGVMQPECDTKSMFHTEFIKMICSHNLAHTFYTNTVANLKSDNCVLIGHTWNGSHIDALRILDEAERSNACSDCPEMGFNAVNYKTKIGRYLVIASTSKPYCQLKDGDKSLLIDGFARLDPTTSFFSQLSKPFSWNW